MNKKKAAQARRLVYSDEHPFRTRKYFYAVDKDGKKTGQCVADEFRRAYQQIKKRLKGKK